MKSKIFEGLKAEALNHLILPLLTIDEYESKIDDNRVIVVGFFVFDKDPAQDLSDFIDKSNISVLDTEVSPAPTEEGYYVVFVELFRNDQFPSSLIKIIKEIENLCEIRNWQLQCPGQENPLDLNEDTLKENLTLDVKALEDDSDEKIKKKKKKKKNRKRNVNESVTFWQSSQVDKILIDNDIINFIKNNRSWTYQLSPDIPIDSINLNESRETNILQNLLGPAYNVWAMRDCFVIEHQGSVRVLKLID